MTDRRWFQAVVRTLATALLAATATTQGSSSQDTDDKTARTLKIRSVADLLLQSPPVPSPRFGILSRRSEEGERQSLLHTSKTFRTLDASTLVRLIRNGLGSTADALSILVQNRTLLVAGDTAQVAKIDGILAALRQALGQHVDVQARLYRITANDDFPAQANAARLAELTAHLPLLWSAHSTARSGQRVALAQERFTSYVYDVDIELAEKSAIGDPKTTSMFEGIHLVVESHTLIGSTDKVLMCQFAIGERQKDIQQLATGVKELCHIGIPHLRASSGAFSGRVGTDGALLLSLQSRGDAGSNLLLVVQARRSGAPDGAEISAGRTLLLPISAMASPSLREISPNTTGDSVDNDDYGTRGGYPILIDDGSTSEDLGDMLVSLLRDNFSAAIDAEDATIDLMHNGQSSGYILIHGSAQIRTQARRLLITLQDHWLQTTEVKLLTGLRNAAPTNTTFSPIDDRKPTAGATTAGTAGSRFHGVTFPSLHGHTALVFKGVESAVIQDFEVGIASGAKLSNPRVRTTFSGIVAGFRGARQGHGLAAELAIDLQYLSEPLRQPTGRSDGGELDHVRVHKAHFQHNGRIPCDETIELGYGPRLRGEETGARLHQTVRFRRW